MTEPTYKVRLLYEFPMGEYDTYDVELEVEVTLSDIYQYLIDTAGNPFVESSKEEKRAYDCGMVKALDIMYEINPDAFVEVLDDGEFDEYIKPRFYDEAVDRMEYEMEADGNNI